MIIVVGGIKGGSGKTTIATNLAVCISLVREKVLLVDADEQRSASDWAEHRESLGIDSKWTTISLLGNNVHIQLKKLKNDYDIIIVDSGGRDTTSQRSALVIADLFIVPFLPRSLDIWTMGKISTLVKEIRSINPNIRAYSILNRADPNGNDNKVSQSILEEETELNFIVHWIGQRKSFANASAEGLGIIELKNKDHKAIAQLNALLQIIYMEKSQNGTIKISKRHQNDSKKKSVKD